MTSRQLTAPAVSREQGSLSPYPRDQGLAALFAEVARLHPDNVALEMPATGGAARLTYRELDQRSHNLAAELVRRGVKPGACVGLCLGRNFECIVALLAVIKARAAYVPLDPAYPAERLRFMLDDAGVKLVLTDPHSVARVPSHPGETLTLASGWGEGAQGSAVEEAPGGTAEELAYVMFTSGTTGTPKGVAIPQRAIVRLVRNNWFTPIDAGSVFLQLAPISFDAATLEIWGPLLNGGTCVLYPGSGVPDFDELGRVIREHKVGHLWLTASLFNLIIDERPSVLSPVRELLTGGEALSVAHIRRALSLLPDTQLINGYGPTESTTFACCHRIPRVLPDALTSIPIGTPIANTSVYVLDEDRRLAAPGQAGELFIGGDGLAQGYFRREALTAEKFVQGPVGASSPIRLYRTGDRVRWLPDGTLEFLGRFDDQVKIRGHRIELGEVTAMLAQHPSVGDAVAVVREDTPGNRLLVAYVTGKDGATPTAGTLRGFLEPRVPDFLIPGAFVVLPRMPLTANGKVDRAALPAPGSARPDLGQAFVAARTPLERRLAAAWSELLGIDQVGIHDRFFELGGTSLLAVRFIDYLGRELGHTIPLVALFDAPTVAQIAHVLVIDFPHVVAAHFDLEEERSTAGERGRARRRKPDAANTRVEIAVVGMGGRFPKAPDLQTFWRNLVEGKEGIVNITAEDLLRAGKDPALLSAPDYVPATFALEDTENFDAGFFGFSPREAEVMDPQLRLFVETAWTTLEYAGYDPAEYKGRIGVFGGVGRNSYLLNNLAPHPHYREMLHEYHMLVGNERDFPTTHASYRLNLTGPSVDVQTACSTSGVAIHLACQSLRAGDSDMALVGGCKVICPNREGYFYVEGGPLAPEGHLRAFSDDANGMVRGSGSAMLLLKRLDEALADGDTVYGLIKGSGINNDGADKIGFTAPSVRGQAEVIREALADAGVVADDISYVEAHGTGTKLGDPIEVAGLTRAYRETTQRKAFCAIGSVKTNIGHLDAGATAAGVIKTLLSLHHEQLPASLNFRAPNPEIDFPNTPFFVNAKLSPWKRGAKPRRAGVSSFGLGGTNVHLIVEEAPPAAPTTAGRADELLVLSARSAAALEAATDRLVTFLGENPALPLADVAHTLQQGRRAFAHRRAVVARSTEEAADALRSRDRTRIISGAAATAAPAVVFMFPGGGAQYASMARGLYESEPVFRAEVDACAALLRPIIGLDIRTLIFPDGDVAAVSRRLETPSLALPALFTIEYAMARLHWSFGVAPAALIGHSMGEYTAACLAGVMSLQDGLALVSCRGRLFETLPEGGMLSVPLGEDEARKHLGPGLDIAAVNRPTQCVASGSVAAIEAAKVALEKAGIESTRIHINVAAHSRLVEPILDEFRAFLRNIRLSAPRIPLVSNRSGTFLTEVEATDPEYWAQHLRGTVQFSRGLQTLFAEGQHALVEVGPGQTLSTFARQHPARPASTAVVSSLRHPQEAVTDGRFLATALGKLWVAGVALDWTGYRKGQRRRRVGLPTYPFERTRHWVEAKSDARGGASPVATAIHAAPMMPGAPGAAAAPAVAPPPPSGLPRKDRIVAELQRIISDLSGMTAEAIDPSATFLELGFDSLFLTQANGQFRAVFGVPMTVRQLLEKTPSVSALAARLDADLPESAFREEAPVAAPAVSSAAAPAGLETIMQALAALQCQVLALAGGAPAAPAPAVARAVVPASAPSAAAAPDRTSPWQPVQKSASGGQDGLSDRQRKHLEELSARVQARTPGSKRLTTENRAHLSDPRTVQGFRKLWKEMVYPIASDRAAGSRLWDVDGNEYIDLVNGYGVTFFGHTPDFIIREVEAQLRKTVAIGPQTPLAGEVTQLVCELVGMDRAALCNTGSEAVLAAIRMARTVTGKRRLATFSGHYHGIFDEVLVKGVNVRGERKSLPISPGIRADVVADVLVLDYGDAKALDEIRAKASELAVVMVEPVRSRNPANQPVEFLRALRKLTEELGIPLLMDEMVTGFRSHPGGVQALWGVKADLATYGKVVGGGFPIGIVAGSRKYMDALDGGQWSYGDDSQPEADMTWFAGTFVRHPPALAAARAVLLRLKQAGPALQEAMAARVKRFADDLNAHFRATSTPIYLEYFSSFFVVKFESYLEYSNLIFYHLHNRGIYTYEGRPAFITTEHSDADMQAVADAFKESVAELQRVGFIPGRPLQGEDEILKVALSEGQQEIWLATRFGDEASLAFNLASTLHLRGALKRPALDAALHALVARHEALRAVPGRDGLTQRILPPSKARMAVEVFDLSGLSAAENASELQRHRAAEVETLFDLDHGPLVRARLCKLAQEEHVLILTAHHVIADGWSCGIMLRDLAALYTAACAGEAAKLPAPIQLSEWVQQQADSRETEERKSAMAYWLDQYQGPAPVLELPTDRPRPARKTYPAARANLDLDAEFTKSLRALATRLGATTFALLLGAYQTMLHRLSGQTDIVVGFSLAGQSNLGGRDLVGHCVNFLPLRMKVEPQSTFTEQVLQARGKVFDAIEHQQVAFGELIKRLNVRRDPSRLPLMSVAFNLDPSGKGVTFGALQAAAGSVPRRYENFDIFFNVVEFSDRLQIQCTYNAGLWDADTMSRRLLQYRTLLESALADAGRPVGQLPMGLADDERQEPAGEIESAIAAAWREVLRREAVGIRDNFFEVGGDATLAVQVIMKVRDSLHVELDLGALFVAPTIAQLAETVAAARYFKEAGAGAQDGAGDDAEEVVI